MADLKAGRVLLVTAAWVLTAVGSAVAQAPAGNPSGACCGDRKVSCTAPPVRSDLTACGQGIAGDPEVVYFAVIGDYGHGEKPCEGRVADMIDGWNGQRPISFVMTVGDNNYEKGSKRTLKRNITKYYGDYVKKQTFFPSLGNHDWYTVKKASGYPWGRPYPYLDYFNYLSRYSPPATPPVEGRYYRAPAGKLIDLFSLDSNYQEPDGTCCNSRQAEWLRGELAKSQAPWKLVFFHHPPYSTAQDSFPGPWMRWPFKEWCASAVLAGHEHVYERFDIDGMPYIVNGLGGNEWIYNIECAPEKGSQARYNGAHGAMLGVANSKEMELCFYSVASAQPVDRVRMRVSDQACTPPPTACTPAPDVAQYCQFQPPKTPPNESNCD